MLEETLGCLNYAAERKLFPVITGDCAIGKMTTIRRFKANATLFIQRLARSARM